MLARFCRLPTSVGNAEIALHELDDRLGEAEFLGPQQHVLGRQLVLHHELGQVADRLARRRHLDDVAEQQVGVAVGLLDVLKLVPKAEREGLLVRKRVLSHVRYIW